VIRLRTFPIIALCCLLTSLALADERKEKSGTIIGELKSMKNINDGKNTMIEVLSPGEEKARSYFVNHDPKIKGPIPDVLKAVRAAKVGDKVEFEWVGTGHGPAIKSFKVLKKGKSSENQKKNALAEHVGHTITLEGTALNAKLGAILHTKHGDVWIDGLDSWPKGYYEGGNKGKRLRVTGTVIERDDLPAYIAKPGEPPKSGIPVRNEEDLKTAKHRFLLKNAKWTAVD